MPFTIGGEWVPSENHEDKKQAGPTKVRKERRKNTEVTVITYLPLEKAALKNLASELKRQLGCGGTIKAGRIEIQGDKVAAVRQFLAAKGYKTS